MKSVSFKQHDAYPEGPLETNVPVLDSGRVDGPSQPNDGSNQYVDPIAHSAENVKKGAYKGSERCALIESAHADHDRVFDEHRKKSSTT